MAAHVQVTPARARSAAAAHVLRCSSRTTPPPCLPAALPLCQAPGQLPAHFGLGACQPRHLTSLALLLQHLGTGPVLSRRPCSGTHAHRAAVGVATAACADHAR